MSTYQIDRAKEREYAEQNNWILFPDQFECRNYAKKVALDIDIELRRPPVFIELDHEFWDKHFNSFTCAELRAKCAALNLKVHKHSKQSYVAVLTQYFRAALKA